MPSAYFCSSSKYFLLPNNSKVVIVADFYLLVNVYYTSFSVRQYQQCPTQRVRWHDQCQFFDGIDWLFCRYDLIVFDQCRLALLWYICLVQHQSSRPRTNRLTLGDQRSLENSVNNDAEPQPASCVGSGWIESGQDFCKWRPIGRVESKIL